MTETKTKCLWSLGFFRIPDYVLRIWRLRAVGKADCLWPEEPTFEMIVTGFLWTLDQVLWSWMGAVRLNTGALYS